MTVLTLPQLLLFWILVRFIPFSSQTAVEYSIINNCLSHLSHLLLGSLQSLGPVYWTMEAGDDAVGTVPQALSRLLLGLQLSIAKASSGSTHWEGMTPPANAQAWSSLGKPMTGCNPTPWLVVPKSLHDLLIYYWLRYLFLFRSLLHLEFILVCDGYFICLQKDSTLDAAEEIMKAWNREKCWCTQTGFYWMT